MRVSRDKRVVKSDLKDAFRHRLNDPIMQSELFDPSDSLAGLNGAAAIKQWADNGRAAAFSLSRKAKIRSEGEQLVAVADRLGVLSVAVMAPQADVDAVVAAFEEWKVYDGYEAWPAFESAQAPVSTEAKAVLAEQTRVRDHRDNSATATSLAVALARQNPGGPNVNVGTVIAGLADSAGGSWTGTSGHGGTLHAVMLELLSRVNKVEEWPVAVCGEVDAMNKYLNARGIQSIADIPRGGLFSHAETWGWPSEKDRRTGRNGRWQGRAACANCEQWLTRIGANMA